MTTEGREERATSEAGRGRQVEHALKGNRLRDILVLVDGRAPVRRLLELALAAADPQQGRVTGLVVYTGSSEAESEAVERIEQVIREFHDAGRPVELKTHSSGSISRGVLDMAREWKVDLLMLAIRRPLRGDVTFGKVAENIISAAPCPVILFRPGPAREIGRIVIPVESGWPGQLSWQSTGQARSASRFAITLGERLDKPVEALYVQGSDQTFWEGSSQLEAALADLPGQERVKRTVVPAEDAFAGLMTRLSDDDLAVIGFSEKGEWERLTQGGTAVSGIG